jgi:streptomycin 3"-adenylyltransferase
VTFGPPKAGLPWEQRYLRCVDARTARAVTFAEHLAEDLAGILGGELVGVYLHGSAAMGCFNPDRSDVDLLVVTHRPLAAARRRAVAELVLASSGVPYPLEMTALATRQLRPWRHPAPFDFHYSERWRGSLAQQLAAGKLRRRSMPLTDPDLAAHVTTLRARGRTLRGEPIHQVFPEVPEADFRQAVLADLDWIGQHSTQVYGVLNACRVLTYLDGHGVLSKAEAADWALDSLPAAHRATVAKAASAYRQGADEPCSPHEVRAFVRWAAARATKLQQQR